MILKLKSLGYSLFRHNFLWVLMAFIFAFGLVSIRITISTFIKSTPTNHTFKWNSQVVYYPGSDTKHIQSHEFQKYFEDLFAKKLRMRNFYVGLNNQMYFTWFKKTFAENSHVIIGKGNQLFEILYILSYCNLKNMQHDDTHLKEWADKIKKLSAYFESQGKTFIYFITPSKAEYMSHAIPDRFPCEKTGISAHVKQMEKLLDERGIRYINGSALMVEATQKYNTDMFPQGGIHWNWLGSSVGANALINAINQDNHVYLNPLRFNYVLDKLKHKESSDEDLLVLMKLMKPLRYKVPQINFENTKITNNPVSITFIGGSFIQNLIKIFRKNRTFSKMNYYFYFKDLYKYEKNDEKSVTHNIDLSSTNILDPILASDVVILEENSSLTVSDHGRDFYYLMKKSAYIT